VNIVSGLTLMAAIAVLACQPSHTSASVDERALREAAGAYQWESNGFLYLQLWKEFSGFDKPSQLVAFDESGEIRVLYPAERDRFVAGPGAAVATPTESRIALERDEKGAIAGLSWQREGAAPRRARRAGTERRDDVEFSNGDIRLSGTLIAPAARGKHPAIILVHGSGPQDREYILPWARFLVRRGVAVLGYDKRAPADRRGTGTLPRSRISLATSWRHSTT
jgi:dipeptidyl aminopeptidase/acylaminoacyl peptidase